MNAQPAPIQAGQPAPNLRLHSLDGEPIALAGFRGRRVLLSCWASWCACRNDLPIWQTLHDRHQNHDFTVLSVAVDVQGAKVVRPYVEAAGVTFPVALDPGDTIGHAAGLKVMPSSLLIDESGIVRLTGAGPTEEFLAAIEQLLRSTPAKSVGPGARSGSSPIDPHLDRATEQINRGEIAEATRIVTRFMQHQPLHIDALMLAASLELGQGNPTAAANHLRNALRQDPANWRIRKQIWAIEHPERFYSDVSPDFDWQREQAAREQAP